MVVRGGIKTRFLSFCKNAQWTHVRTRLYRSTLPVCGVTPMYRVQFRGYRSRWAAASRGITPRQFVRAQTIQASSRIFVEYALAVEFRVTEAGPEHVLIADRWRPAPSWTPS